MQSPCQQQRQEAASVEPELQSKWEEKAPGADPGHCRTSDSGRVEGLPEEERRLLRGVPCPGVWMCGPYRSPGWYKQCQDA